MFLAPDLERYRDQLTRDLVDSCGDCRGTGFVVQDADPDAELWEPPPSVPCHCQREVARRAALLGGHVPTEFWTVEKLKFTRSVRQRAEVETYTEDLPAHRREGTGYLFVGENGTGKTASACVILCRAARQGFSIGYLTAQEFVTSSIPAARDPELGTWRSAVLGADFLVLDELGKEYRKEGSEYAQAELDGLLRWRRGELRPTIIATNYSVPQLQAAYGESLWSVLLDRMTRLVFDDGDFRIELAGRKRGKK